MYRSVWRSISCPKCWHLFVCDHFEVFFFNFTFSSITVNTYMLITENVDILED